MKTTIKTFSVLLCLILCSAFCLPIAAENTIPTITVSSLSAMPGDEVTIDVDISNNPGIMGMTFSVTYDKDAFEYKSFAKGVYTSIQGSDKPDKGHIIFTVIESKDISTDGKLLSVTFTVKEKAAPGKHVITIANHMRDKYGYDLHNCFSNSKTEKIVPTVKTGNITVGETCINAGHKYGEWSITAEADCSKTGLKNHTCERCQYTEEVEIPITHDFEADWTVDKAATPQEDGIMSRHCTKCEAVTDEITFSYEEIGGDDTQDSSSDTTDDENDSDNKDDSVSSDYTSSDITSKDEAADDKKPVIDNTEGAKNPISEVEKLEDYKENIENDSKEDTDTNTNSNSDTSDSAEAGDNIVTDVPSDSSENGTDESDKTSKKSQSNILLIALGALLIVVLILLIFVFIKRKNKIK